MLISEQDVVDRLTASVTEKVAAVVKESLSEIVQQEVSKALARALIEGQFYRLLNTDVIDGIENIYSEIRSVKKSLSGDLSRDSLDLLNETDTILDGIVRSTEDATLKVLDFLEIMQQEIKNLAGLVDQDDKAACKERLNQLDRLTLDIMTALSFQDLTGQQIKRVIQSVKKVEEIVFDVYVTSEVFKKSRDNSPESDTEEFKEKTKNMPVDAKSSKSMADQDGVDSLLEQLGL